mgnify:CR=1 FL=1
MWARRHEKSHRDPDRIPPVDFDTPRPSVVTTAPMTENLSLAQRKHLMQSSNWVAASKDGAQEFIPVSWTPLDHNYLHSISAANTAFHQKKGRDTSTPVEKVAPASSWVAKRGTSGHLATDPKAIGTFGASIVLGSDPPMMGTSNDVYGKTQDRPLEAIDLLTTVPIRRDTTLDGAHRASMQEVPA